MKTFVRLIRRYVLAAVGIVLLLVFLGLGLLVFLGWQETTHLPQRTYASSEIASAMAASAAVELMGGNPQQCLDAASTVLMNMLGLVCDPVAGLVEVPCVKRNVIGAVNAISAADMALAGIESRIPFDEVIDAMGEVGRRMPVEFRETALGGLAATPTGKQIKERMPKGAR